ncbi:EamA family transporter [bacterium]|nr:EamA family transporter [bacterium]
MKTPNWLLFAAACLIWGTTWYAIKFQLNGGSPLLSIAYRFSIAAALLFSYLLLRKKQVKYSLNEHFWFALQGFLLFGLCYWFTYLAESGLTSGLVAVLSSLIIFFNVVFGKILLKRPILPKLIVGFLLGICGMALLYKDELATADFSNEAPALLIIAVLSNLIASLGNIVSMRNQSKGLPVQQTNAFGMLYGAVFMYLLALIKGDSWHFSTAPSYILSLIYLGVFGSVVAFYCYLTLLGRLGPGRAAYTNLVIPIIALLVSTLFESFQWNWYASLGLALVLAGNWVALFKPVKTGIPKNARLAKK